jgi:hypothetical protein
VHSAPFQWQHSLRFRHDKTISHPKAGFLCVRVARRVQIATIVARIKLVIGFSPVARKHAYRIFYHVWRFRPFGKSECCVKETNRIAQRSKPFVLKPPCTTHANISAWWKREQHFDFSIWRQPFPNVGPHTDNLTLAASPAGCSKSTQ